MSAMRQPTLVAIVSLLGCTAPKQPAVHEQPAEIERPPALILHASPSHRRPHPAERPGPAYFLSDGELVALDEAGWRTIDSPKLDWRGLEVGADGHAYARASASVHWLDDGRLVSLASVESPQRLWGVAIGGAGEIAAMTDSRDFGDDAPPFLHYVHHGLESASPDPFPIYLMYWGQVAFDRHGRLWAWDSLDIRYVEWRWPTWAMRQVGVGLPKPADQPATFAASSTGEIYMFVDEAVYLLSEPQAAIRLPGVRQPSRAAVSPTGSLALAWYDSCELGRVVLDDPPRIEPIEHEIDCHFEDRNLAIDGRDRIWVTASYLGVWVLAPGEAPIEYGFGTTPHLAAKVSDFAIVGAGPSLLPPGPIRTAGLAGRLDIECEGQSNEHRTIVLESSTNGSRPRRVVLRTTTDEHGNFSFAEVPIGVYWMRVEDGPAMRMLTETARVREGEVLDIGRWWIRPNPFLTECQPIDGAGG